MSNTLSEKLKERTKINHQNLEKKLLEDLKRVRSLVEYAELLVGFYCFFGGLEPYIAKHIRLDTLPDYPFRRKTAAMLDDLKSIGSRIPVLADIDALPPIGNHFQALGALYVIEGSTLGGQIICKMLRAQMISDDPKGLSFFSGYQDQTYEMWSVFKETVDGITEPKHEELVIDSANETFLRFTLWFDQHRERVSEGGIT